MAHYDVNHSCGHTVEVELFGKTSARYEKIEWMERGVCPDCYRAEKEKEREQENERAETLAKSLGFSELEGSVKQVAWATTIRQKTYENFCKMGTPHPIYGYALIAEAISLEGSAKWWINNRQVDFVRIFKTIAANYPSAWQTIQARGKEKEVKN